MISGTTISFIYYELDFELGGVGSMLQIGWFSQEVSGGPRGNCGYDTQGYMT